jgi:hypothetical protein
MFDASPRRAVRSQDVDAVSQQQHFVGTPRAQAGEPGQGAANDEATRDKRWDFGLGSLRLKRVPLLDKATREERALEKERERELASVEEAKEAFFQTPAGRARLSYQRGHRLFQYELQINELEPLVIPGLVGSSPRETTDPVDVLNSVIVEGWKLVSGKFIHSEMRGGVIGCYLFKRSQKRRLRMNNPWKA